MENKINLEWSDRTTNQSQYHCLVEQTIVSFLIKSIETKQEAMEHHLIKPPQILPLPKTLIRKPTIVKNEAYGALKVRKHRPPTVSPPTTTT